MTAPTKAIPFDVKNWITGEVQFTAQIECAADELPAIKLGLAVKWAYNNGASLNGASLNGASLYRANLDGASLYRANLYRANLDGASLDGANLIVGGHRSDGYRFLLVRDATHNVMVRAGCRFFSVADARDHWTFTRGGTALGAESLALVDDLERRAGILGWFETINKQAAE